MSTSVDRIREVQDAKAISNCRSFSLDQIRAEEVALNMSEEELMNVVDIHDVISSMPKELKEAYLNHYRNEVAYTLAESGDLT